MRRADEQEQAEDEIEDAEDEIGLEDELVGVFGEKADELDDAEREEQHAEQDGEDGIERVREKCQPYAREQQQRGEDKITGFCDFQHGTHGCFLLLGRVPEGNGSPDWSDFHCGDSIAQRPENEKWSNVENCGAGGRFLFAF